MPSTSSRCSSCLRIAATASLQPAQVNGYPALILRLDGEIDTVIAVRIDDGLITGERFLNRTTLIWDAESDSTSYNVYRGDLGLAALAPYASCFVKELPTRFTSDPDIPNPSDGFFYLVTRLIGPEEGPLGYTSANAPRQVLIHCP